MKLQSFLIRMSLLLVFVAITASSALAQASAVPARLTQPVDLHNLVTLHGNVHPLARPEFDQGVAPDDLPMERMLLVLQRSPDQESALRQMLDDQQVKASPQFHQWLTPEQFGQQFGPADSDVQAVTGWLASQGFQVAKVAAGRTVIEFSGSAGLVRQVLGTDIHKFRVNGNDYWANTTDPQIPAALAPVVAGFASLNNFPAKPMHENLRTISRPAAQSKAQPLFTYPVVCPGESAEQCYTVYLGPTDFATIYNVLPLWNKSTDGTGVTIAVVGESNINPQDVADFRAMFGLPANSPNIIVNGPDPGLVSDETEADLDVEWSGAVAKGATVDLVIAESTEATLGVDLSALYIVDNDLAPILSESFGVCEAQSGTGGNIFHSTLWEQAAAEGITVLLASGDSGSAVCDRGDPNFGVFAAQYGLSVSGFASTLYNVAVGGTNLNITSSNISKYFTVTNTPNTNSSALSYIPEITWNDSCAASGSLTGCTPPPSTPYLDEGVYLVAGSGGASNCISPSGTFPNVTCTGKYPKPSWQTGTGVPNDSARDVPDVSLLATGYVICQMDANDDENSSLTTCNLDAPQPSFQVVGGTSASVQAFAGIMAMVNQAHGRQGNANYVLYPLAAQTGASCNSTTAPVTNSNCIFYDVTVGNNSVICVGGSPNCSNTNSASGQYGILVSGNPSLAAFTTTSGYDLATGLGSINAANLVTNWKSNFTPSSITLALATNPATNPITPTHGQPIDYTIKVSSGGGTPSGDVSLTAQAGEGSNQTTAIGPFTLSAGSASGSTIMLPGGSYSVTAHYAGNGTYAASDSTPGIPVVVSKESSKTEIQLVTLNPTTGAPTYGVTNAPYGSFYLLRMDVTNSSGQLCASAATGLISYPCPTGALSVSPPPSDQSPPAGTVAGSYTLNSQGFAEDQPIQQTPGVYNFVASYAGDNSFTSSISTAVPVTITKAPTTTTFTGLPASSLGGNVTLNVTVGTQSDGAIPSGKLQLLNNGSPFGPLIYVNGGTPYSASTKTYATGTNTDASATLPAGADNISVQYSGDSNYASSTSVPAAIAVSDFSVSYNPTNVTISAPGQSGTTAITLTPLGGFSGTVSLSCNPTYGGTFCTISPTSVNLSGSSAVIATMTITTTAKTSLSTPTAPPTAGPHAPMLGRGFWYLMALLALIAMAIFIVTQRDVKVCLVALALMVACVWVACGGGGGGGGGDSYPQPAPQVLLNPSTLFFSQQNVNSTSTGQTATVSNFGNAGLTISNVGLTGTNAADFAQTNNCSGSVAAGGKCTIGVTFTPTAVGSRTASLVVTDNASGSPQSINITGTGALLPVAAVSPTSLTFGQVNDGFTSPPQTVTLSNTGSAAMTLSSVTFNGSDWGDFKQTNSCGGIAPGANCPISVVFAPLNYGYTSTASMLVVTDPPTNPLTVGLTGSPLPNVTPPGSYYCFINATSGTDAHNGSITFTVQ